MSLISEQIDELRDLAVNKEIDGIKDLGRAFRQAANTIETLAGKLALANMERSSAYYNDRDLDDAMIRASRKTNITTNDLSDAYKQSGLIAVYNLGLKDMYEYLTKSK